ncbi:hypothetical protein HWV07_02800 [Natronomonas salina]|uniref:C2H2-type zinc finger protein n=1 Tax=Natronomonas salina TaxID=1710540 RepID=UPI0015B5ADC9|nr:C2H2-type zinc finger protein [Natronomonas salina]QLD88023.1 hypothetical protein HWV07_02800 [Natronomonas salina]
MDCPRCDGRLERYALGGREAVSCDRCGYIGVPVEHRGELRDGESWDDAITRFNEVGRVSAGTVETSDAPTPEFDDAGDDPQPTVVRVSSPASDLTVEAGQNTAIDGDAIEDGATDAGDGVACDVCGKRFDAVAQLNGHMAVHSGEE